MRPLPRTLLILPDADRVEHALLEAAEQSEFVDGRGFTTLGRVIDACRPALALGRRPCPPLTARLLLSTCAAGLEDHPFGPWAREAAFAREAQALIFQLKGQRSTPQELARAAARLTDGAARARATALAHLWEAYEAALMRLELADREDLAAAATSVLEKGLPAPLCGFSHLEVRHLYDWPPSRQSLVRALARACERAGVGFRLELPFAGDPSIDALVNEAMAAFERTGAEDAAFAAVALLAQTPTQAWALRRLFGDDERDPPQLDGLAAFSAATAIDEVKELARRVRVALDAGASAEHVAVAFRSLESEAEAVVAALAEKGVAARTRRGVPLAATALGRLALGLPALVEADFPKAELAHYLESPYVTVGRSGVDPEPTFRAAGVRDDALGAQGRRGAYRVRLGALADRLGPSRNQAVLELQKDVDAFLSLCAPLRQARTFKEQLEAWKGLVKALGLLEAARAEEPLDDGAPALARAALAAAASDQAAAEAVTALGAALDDALTASRAGARQLSLSEFARWLADAAGDLSLPAHGARTGAVRVLDVRELSGRRLSHLFLGGLVDGRLPSRPQQASLLSDAARTALNKAAGKALFRVRAGEGDERLLVREAEDRLVFAQALCAAPSVTLSHPRLDAEGKSALPSPWLHALARGPVKVEVERLPLGVPPPLSRVHCARELRLRVALEALSHPGTRLSAPDDAAPLLAHRFGQERWFAAAREVARIERERFDWFEERDPEPGPHAGGVRGRDVQAVLDRRLAFGPDAPLSVTALQHWGNCAFSGFALHLLGLAEPEAQAEEIGARERGTLLHTALEVLVPRLRAEGLLSRPRAQVGDAVLGPLLDEALAAAKERTARRAAHGNPALWELTRASLRAAVLRVIDGEQATPFEGAAPEQVEVGFGEAGQGLGLVHVAARSPAERDVYLKGKIDRVDRGPGKWAVLDYKSSVKAPGELKAALLESEFQLPVYLHALRQAKGEGELLAAWQSLKDGEVVPFEKALGSRTLEEVLGEALPEALHRLLAQLRRGNFGPRAHDCRYCQLDRVCRISTRRVTGEEDSDGA